VAATIFGDAGKVKYVALTSRQPLTAVQSGEVDIVMSNPTTRSPATPRSASISPVFTIATEPDDQTHPGVGKALGVDEQWAYNIVKQVGNYGESFNRNLGKDSTLKVDRDPNQLWIQGGLQYAPHIR
jgi:hypothetical protein